jgi:hypothetical protein
MRLAVYSLAGSSRGAKWAPPPQGQWARFGDDVLVYEDEAGAEKQPRPRQGEA